jgi:hypothetical protein
MATRALRPTDSITVAIDRYRASRDRGVAWLLNHIASDGKPVDADKQNGWGRVPWALAVSGASDAGHAVLAWVERNALAADGRFHSEVHGGNNMFGAYGLAHFALGAWLLERYDLALRSMGALRLLQQPVTGGIPVTVSGDDHPGLCDLLSTAQVGLAALMTKQDDIVDGIHRWIVELIAQQKELPKKFYSMRVGEALLSDPSPDFAWLGITDFGLPRQTYYTSGITAVFMAGYAMQRGDAEALAIGHRMLDLNINGHHAQFDDLESVQACKFGWGVAAMQMADSSVDYGEHLLRMGEWFIDRQADDGAWTPSHFMSPNPTMVQTMIKTAEHVMEVNAIVAALGKLVSNCAA